MAKTYDLGSVTSYAIAVEHGYEGTEEQFAQELTGATAAARAAAQDASDAEAYAIGKRDGVDVPSTDPAYQNNAKYWAQNSSGANLGEAFSTTKAYSAGDYVINLGKLWRFNTAHPAGAWTGNDTTEVKAMDEVRDLKDDLSEAPGLTNAAREALLNLVEHVAYIDEHGQEYYDALCDELYNGLVRIEAIFTQGSAVFYENTPIDDLRTYLVVTGYYKDGTSKDIADYSLSGTLSLGTSTVTVIFGRKMDEFDVVVSSDPNIVYQLKNRHFDGTDYIDTGLTPFEEDSDWSIVADLTNEITSSSAVVRIFGSINSSSPYAGIFVQRDSASSQLIKFAYMTSASTSYDNPQFLSVYNLRMAMTHVRGSGNAKLVYKFNNGNVVQETLNSAYQTITANLLIGHAGGDLWEGTMHQFTLYRKALTDDEVSAFMQEV